MKSGDIFVCEWGKAGVTFFEVIDPCPANGYARCAMLLNKIDSKTYNMVEDTAAVMPDLEGVKAGGFEFPIEDGNLITDFGTAYPWNGEPVFAGVE